MSQDASGWEQAYQRSPTGAYRKPGLHREVVEPLPDLFRANGVKRVLDLGCGDGVQMYFFARQGFEVCGLDYAPTAVRLVQQWFESEKLACDVKCARMESIPWPDGSFDAVISTNAFDHNDAEAVRRTAAEAHRVLRDGGMFFANVLRVPESGEWPPERMAARMPEEIEPRTLVPKLGHDAGVPHHYFTEEELRDVLSGFSQASLEMGEHIVFTAQK